jgi:ketosteroid isomerase-like protein
LEITWIATHSGPLELPSGTLPATGKSVEFDGVQIFIVEGGKVTHMRHYLDLLTMLSQVGAIPG